MAEKYDGKRPASLDIFLEKLGLTEEEFIDIVSCHQVKPWQFDPEKVEPGEPLPDMNRWARG